MKRSKVTQKDILFFSISMFVIVIAWIAFSIYHSVVTTTISEDLQMQIVPIDPRFDTETIIQLKNREQVKPLLDATTPQASTPAKIEPTQTLIEQQLDDTEETIPEEELNLIESETTPAI